MIFIDKINSYLKSCRGCWIWTAFILLVCYFIPYSILQQDSCLRIFDNLDGEIIYKILTARKGLWLNYDSVIPEIMNGLPRFCITSGLNFTTLLFGIFPPFIAYLINDFIMRFIGFIGMYLLMKRYILRTEQKELQALLIAGGYILIAYFTIYGLTDLGQPLVLYSFLNILRERQTFTDYICILLFPFFSSFVLSGFFVGIFLAIVAIIEMWKKKKIQKAVLGVLLGYIVSSFIVEYNLIIPVLTGFQSHREEIVFGFSSDSYFKFMFEQLWETYIHPGQFYTLPIWFLVVCALFSGGENKRTILRILFCFVIVYIIIISIFYVNPSIKGFRFSRFYHLLPLFWFLLLGNAINLLKRNWTIVGYLVLSLQISFLFVRHVNYVLGNKLRNNISKELVSSYPSYASFYSCSLFKEIECFIGKEKSSYRVLNIGILPAVSQYNGFYTLDSYQNNYPLSYKHQFRDIMTKELEKKPKQAVIFDEFSNWCYIFPAEVEPTKIIEGKYNKHNTLYNLELNPIALKKLSCDYVFSSAEIKNSENIGLRFLHFFSEEKSHWDVWLYEVF